MIDLIYEGNIDIVAILPTLVSYAIILVLGVILVRRMNQILTQLGRQIESSDKQLVNELLCLTPGTTRYDLWKYFEDHADRLRERLWTIGTWLVTILIAVLALPFTVKFIQVEATKPLTLQSVVPSVQSPIPLLGVALFGLAFGVYACFVVWDLRKHIKDNWRMAGFARGKDETPSLRRTGSWILYVLIGLQLIAFCGLVYLGVVELMAKSETSPTPHLVPTQQAGLQTG